MPSVPPDEFIDDEDLPTVFKECLRNTRSERWIILGLCLPYASTRQVHSPFHFPSPLELFPPSRNRNVPARADWVAAHPINRQG